MKPASDPPPGTLARNTAALAVGFFARTPILLVYFVIATRTLGVADYGVLAAISAVCAITGPLAAFGSTHLLIRHASQDLATARIWLGSGLTVSSLGSVVVGAFVIVIAPVLLPPETPFAALALLLAGELVLARIVEMCSAVFVASERMHLKTLIQIGLPVARLGAAVLLLAGPWSITLTNWALAAVIATGVWSVLALVLAVRAVGSPSWSLRPYLREWRQGLLFAAGLGVLNVHNEADKIVVARIAGPEAAGVYAAAYRVLEVAYTPIRALLGAAFPRMFRHGAAGSTALGPLLRRLLRYGVGYSLLAVPGVVLLAPLVPRLLGDEFADVAPVLASLSVLILLRTVRALPADTLTGAGYQGRRTVAQLVVAVVNVALLLALVPPWGIWGAVCATLVAEALLAAILWLLWWQVWRAERQSTPVGAQPR